MKRGWEVAIPSLSQVTVHSSPNNGPVTIQGHPEGLRCIGVGTDAAVFQYLEAPLYAFKIFAEDKRSKVEIETNIYRKLGNSTYFPNFYASTPEYLVLSYEEGITLFDCVLQGVHIPCQVVDDVEEARDYVREIGLNPRDIHLKNILLQNGRAKIIDVSEYAKPGNDFRWEHLRKGYERHYHLIDGKCVPYWLVETVRKWYNQWDKHHVSYEDFLNRIMKFNPFKRG
ncbi:serine/threonine protein kinase [Halobacillus yeomjeoni]|uniref:Serine/threonine protein kinase n=1 Tax=Halobacillus yeomjeoni TaxID=311194 RepID=A0A931HUL3_9BACI|nr:serine/threonine protein kinase [Halobacillus yeomjeoni]MBH0229699.1 serine/threonine protein kinase [Halobacillus yeomjeoni]